MSRYKIYSSGGVELYEGCPTYVGQYMKPGTLTFRNVSSPVPINFAVGCYAVYDKVRPLPAAIPTHFSMCTIPAMKKLARRRTNGDSFVYDQVVLYDDTKLFDYIPFRDVVPVDNGHHFSSRESFSVYDNVAGIVERIQACVDLLYPSRFVFGLATLQQGATQELLDLMNEDREVSFSATGTVTEALQKIYDVWPNVGWVQFQTTASRMGVMIGGAGLVGTTHTFRYGEGLTDVANNIANENEIANVIFPFGNTKNMPHRYYNGLNIYDKESVDIPNLMIPLVNWGQKDGVPDAAQAKITDADSVATVGSRPKVVYFNGQNDLEDIYPTVKGLTTTDLIRELQLGGTVDYPPALTDTGLPLDSVVAVVQNPKDPNADFDDGYVGEDGKASVARVSKSLSGSGSASYSAGDGSVTLSSLLPNCTILNFPATVVKPTVRVKLTNTNLTVTTTTQTLRDSIVDTAYLRCLVYYYEIQGGTNKGVYKSIEIPLSGMGRQRSLQNDVEIVVAPPAIAQIGINSYFAVEFEVVVEYTGATDAGTFSYTGSFDAEVSVEKDVEPNFQIRINPFGYDLTNLVATEGKVRLAMTSG